MINRILSTRPSIGLLPLAAAFACGCGSQPPDLRPSSVPTAPDSVEKQIASEPASPSLDSIPSKEPESPAVGPVEAGLNPVEPAVDPVKPAVAELPEPYPDATLLDDIQRAFERDAGEAGRQYGRQTVRFRAVVLSPAEPWGFGGRLQVRGLEDPKGDESLEIVIADLARGQLPKAETLCISQEVVLEGVCYAQDNVLKILQFGDCRLLHAAPDPSIEISAEAFVRAYQEDEGAADGRFDGKPMLIAGSVLAIDEDGLELQLRGANGSDGKPVKICFSMGIDGWKKVRGRLKPGDRVKVRGFDPYYREWKGKVTLTHGRVAE